MPFKKLFHSAPQPDDGFTQAEREAVVDVLHYCMYADRHVARSEDEMIERVARTLHWDPAISYEYYEGKSTGAVRTALAGDVSREAFLQDLRRRLPKTEHRAFVLKLASELIAADGTQPQEVVALQALKDALQA